MIKLGSVVINETDYAIQGNCIFGIRESGKTYSGMFFAEKLMDAGIPIIAIDPIGVWKFLKVGKNGKSGYPVVVIGGKDGDIPISPDTIEDVVRAAMLENISIVIDLYTLEISKAQMRTIVAKVVSLLLYENGEHGLRHIFIEEAAEVVPQRVMGHMAVVYGAIESMARMGRNAGFGYTLINQRPEEVNKAVTEICDLVLLHRQKGRNVITSLDKWFEVVQADERDDIIKSLPNLNAGQCWVWPKQSRPMLVQIPEKKTAHPDPRTYQGGSVQVSKSSTDVTKFVSRMKMALERIQKAPKPVHDSAKVHTISSQPVAVDDTRVQQLIDEIVQLKRKISEQDVSINRYKSLNARLIEKHRKLTQLLEPQYTVLKSLYEDNSEDVELLPTESHYETWLNQLGGGEKRMLQAIIVKRRLTAPQWKILATVKNRESFRIYKNHLVSYGLVTEEGEYFTLREI